MAPCYGVLGCALTAHLVWISYWVARPLGVCVSIALVCTALVVVLRSRVWRSWRSWSPFVVGAAGVAVATIGLGFLYGGARNPFVTIAARHGGGPPDNVLPHLFADRIWNDASTTGPLADWNGSDRPPLQSGFLLLVRPHELFTGAPGADGAFDPELLIFALAAGLVAQLVWMPAVWSLLRALDFSERSTTMAIIFCAFTPVVFRNTFYTWPKLLSAGLAVCAIALLVDLTRNPRKPWVPVTAASMLGTLAFLAHGSAAFAAPLLLGMALVALLAVAAGPAVRAALLAAGAAVALYLPWHLYGLIADPSTGRLLKWHLAGVVQPNDEGVLETMVESYRSTSPELLWDARLSNLAVIFDVDLSGRLDSGPGWLGRVWAQDFFSTSFALGIGSLLTVALLVTSLWSLLARRRSGDSAAPRPRRDTQAALVVWLSLVSIVLWALLMFVPGTRWSTKAATPGSWCCSRCLLCLGRRAVAGRGLGGAHLHHRLCRRGVRAPSTRKLRSHRHHSSRLDRPGSRHGVLVGVVAAAPRLRRGAPGAGPARRSLPKSGAAREFGRARATAPIRLSPSRAPIMPGVMASRR